MLKMDHLPLVENGHAYAEHIADHLKVTGITLHSYHHANSEGNFTEDWPKSGTNVELQKEFLKLTHYQPRLLGLTQ